MWRSAWHKRRQGILWGISLSFLLVAGCGGASNSGTASTTSATATGSSEVAEVASESSTVDSIAEMQKGDIYFVDLSSGSATLDLLSSDASAQYILGVQSIAERSGSTAATVGDVALPQGSVHKGVDLSDAYDAQEYFDAFLRSEEALLDVSALLPNRQTHSPLKNVTTAKATGDSQTFRVLSSLSSTSAYREVVATAKCVNATMALYVDDSAPAVLSTDQFNALCTIFDSALQQEYSILGDPSDINGDGVVNVLMTCAVNALGGSGGGIVTGFFFAGDLLSTSATPASNQQEIVHVLVPDPDGECGGTPIPTAFALSNLLTAVVPHEVQHLLSYYYHVMVNAGSTEAIWLNEAMAHLMEDVVGYGQENPSRVDLYLANTASTAVIPSGSPGLTERGASYLFLHFLYEQTSNSHSFLRQLVQNDLTSVDNIEAAFGSGDSSLDSWAEFLLRWGVAVALTDAGVTSDSRFIYRARTFNTSTNHWQGVCLNCLPEDGRSTVLGGVSKLGLATSGLVSIRSGATAYYDLSSPPSEVTVSSGSSDTMQGFLIRTN